MVKLRLKRFGRRHKSIYRLHAIDSRRARNGMSIEELGFYSPDSPNLEQAIKLNTERIQYWLSHGAQTSDTVRVLLAKAGIELPKHIGIRHAKLVKSRKSSTVRLSKRQVANPPAKKEEAKG